MTVCDELPFCVFFDEEVKNLPAVADLLKMQYCKGDFERCARWRVASKLGRAQVPHNLFPNDWMRAGEILEVV